MPSEPDYLASSLPDPESAPLTPTAVAELCRRLRLARADGLAQMPVREIVAAIDRAAASWADPDGPRAGRIEALAAATGYHPAMVAWALDDLSRSFCAPALERLLVRELGTPAVLDGFVTRRDGRGWERAYGPELTVIVLSGNVFHVAVEAMALGLLAKSACLVKTSRRDRFFPLWFANTLRAIDLRLAGALTVVHWRGGDQTIEQEAFRAADAVVVYGAAEAVASVRAHTPATARLIAHGPKVSFAVVSHACATGATAQAAAHDVAMFDQQGCVSPHVIYVLDSYQTARNFAAALATALEDVERTLPRGRLTAAETMQIWQVRSAAEFRPGVEIFADQTSTAWTVIVDPDPVFTLSCLNRVVYVKPLARLSLLPKLLQPVQPYLQTAGVAGDERLRIAVAEIAGPLGVARVCPLGQMQHPPAEWRHDGRPRLLDLLRWTEVEPDRG